MKMKIIFFISLLFTLVYGQCDTVQHANQNCICIICPDTVIVQCSLPIINHFDYILYNDVFKVYWEVESNYSTRTTINVYYYNDTVLDHHETQFVFNKGDFTFDYHCIYNIVIELISTDINGEYITQKLYIPSKCVKHSNGGRKKAYYTLNGKRVSHLLKNTVLIYYDGFTFTKKFYVD